MLKILTTSIALLATGCVTAQMSIQAHQHFSILSTVNMDTYKVDVIDGVATVRYTNDPAGLSGSPYFNDEFLDGCMTTLDGTIIPGLKYRYDIYGDKIDFILNGDTATIRKPLALRSVEVGEQKFVYEVYLLNDNSVATGYFELLQHSDYLSVLLKREVEFEQDIYMANYGGGGGTKAFNLKQVHSLYLKHGESAALKISNKRDLLEAIPDHREQVKEFMKEKELSIKRAEDIQDIARYYNSMQKSGS